MIAADPAWSVSHEPIDYDPFAGGELSMVVPTTESQREIWLGDQFDQDASRAFNLSVSLRLRGRLDVECLRLAVQELVDRHDALRASVGPDGESFCVLRTVAIPMSTSDLRGLEARARIDAISARLRNATDTPFSLATGPLFRAELLRVGDDEHLLLLTAHHIACDGWSWRVVARDLGAVYAYRSGFTGAPPPEPVSFAQYALAEASEQAGKVRALDEAFWLSRFCGEVPVLDLPTDHPRPARRTFVSSREDHELDAALLAALRSMSSRHGASLFSALLAGFSGLLSRLSGQRDVVVGIPAAGQPLDGYDNLVGHCVNLLPLRLDVDPSESFGRAIDAVQAGLIDALEHQHYTFGTLLKRLHVRRDPARTPLVSVLFNLEQALDQERTSFPGLQVELESIPREFETFELYVNAVQVHGGLRLECQYNRDLYDGATVRCWLRALEAMLRAAVERESVELGSLPLVDAVAQAELQAWNANAVPLHAPATLHAMLAEQFRATPHADAIHFRGHILRYSQLNARSERIAAALAARGVAAGDLVGVCLGRHTDLVATLIGVLAAGAAYVPLDPAYPPERLRFMAEDAGLRLVVSEGDLAEPLQWPRDKLLLLDADAARIESATLPARVPSVGPDALAYLIYTSGSTGKPKGVRVHHGAVVNLLRSMRREPGIVPSDRLMAVTTTSFDIAVLELFLPLTVGASIVLASREEVFDGAELARLLTASNATMMQATPSVWRLLLESGWVGPRNFKALCGGEPLPVDLAEQLFARGFELWNMYGPTETTVWSTCANVRPPMKDEIPDIHVGHPIDNTTVWVLDPRGQPCPPGVSGEIYIGGAGVTLGYHERPELTARRFVADRFTSVAAFADSMLPPRLYRTGDRGRWRHDGVLKYEGRLDFQVKLRGHRIEPGEIESCLASCKEIARAVVIVREDHLNDQRLVAYVVAKPAARIDESALRTQLRGILPAYMVPQHIVALDALPLLPNGKLDRNALPLPGAGRAAIDMRPEAVIVDPRVRYLAGVWSELLGTPVGAADNFFDVGGNSMLAVQMANRVAADTGVRIKLVRLASHDLESIASELPKESGPAMRTGRGAQLIEKAKRMFGAHAR